MSDYNLIDNKEEKRYEIHVDGYTCMIEYIKTNNDEIYLTHTEVPYEIEGRGVGSMLVEKVLSKIEDEGFRLVPLCPFVAGYIQKHPEWRKIVMQGINV